jgi:hypothetical protein
MPVSDGPARRATVERIGDAKELSIDHLPATTKEWTYTYRACLPTLSQTSGAPYDRALIGGKLNTRPGKRGRTKSFQLSM